VYAADHGDALGDEGNFIRGGSMKSPYLRQVPFVIWVSEAYERTEPEKVSWLRAHTDLKVAHENLFHTVLGLSGIQSALVDARLDLSSPQAVARAFEVRDGVPANSAFHVKR
jgi:lipid A ethanolaminephosphotransferase